MKIALIIIVPLIFFGIVGGVAFYFIKKSTPKGTEEEVNPKTVQDFLPVEDISDGYIILKNKRLRKVIKCSSTNYNLKMEDEQTSIEMIFQQFINSLSFPITMFIQTRVIDNSKRMKILRKDVEKAKRKFPELNDYARKYIDAMSNINEIIGNSLEKNKYIIVPYDDEIKLTTATEEEKVEYMKSELENRCQLIINGLSRLGVRAKTLNDNELIELFYSTFNRDNYSYSDNITKDEALATIVGCNEDIFSKADLKKNLRASLTAAINVLETNSRKLTEKDLEHEKILRQMYEEFNRPAIVLTTIDEEKKILRGSARSIEKFPLKENFDKIQRETGIFETYGGHKKAAGLSIKRENLGKLRELLNKEAERILNSEDIEKKVVIDASITTKDLSVELVEDIENLGPFGEGFPEPVIGINFSYTDIYKMGDKKQHLKFLDKFTDTSVIMWNGSKALDNLKTFKRKAVGTLSINSFRDKKSAQLIVNDGLLF
jgi:hypothetical protein